MLACLLACLLECPCVRMSVCLRFFSVLFTLECFCDCVLMRLVACLRACMCLWYACNHLHAFLYSCSAGYLRICWLVSLNVQWLCIRMLEWSLSILLGSCILDFLCGCITHLHTVSCMHASMYLWMPIWLCIFVLCSCVVRVRMCSCVPVYASVDIVSRITVTDCMFYCVSAQQDGQFVRLHVCMVELPMTVCLYTRVDAGLYVCMPLCMCDSACCLVWL